MNPSQYAGSAGCQYPRGECRCPGTLRRRLPDAARSAGQFEREVDPDGKLSPQERAKRAEYARKAHMQRMAWKSVKARRRRKT